MQEIPSLLFISLALTVRKGSATSIPIRALRADRLTLRPSMQVANAYQSPVMTALLIIEERKRW